MGFQSQYGVHNTRKDHQCSGCLEIIPKGSHATRMSGTFEGEFYSVIICDACDQFLTANHDYFEDGWGEGDIGMARKEIAR